MDYKMRNLKNKLLYKLDNLKLFLKFKFFLVICIFKANKDIWYNEFTI